MGVRSRRIRDQQQRHYVQVPADRGGPVTGIFGQMLEFVHEGEVALHDVSLVAPLTDPNPFRVAVSEFP